VPSDRYYEARCGWAWLADCDRVWLDAAGLARRISVSSEPAAAADAQVWSIVELWDFGVAVDITPPGPDEVLAPSEAYRLAEEETRGRNA
jgi:hypothetical protein